jgi:hypothetical protein
MDSLHSFGLAFRVDLDSYGAELPLAEGICGSLAYIRSRD